MNASTHALPFCRTRCGAVTAGLFCSEGRLLNRLGPLGAERAGDCLFHYNALTMRWASTSAASTDFHTNGAAPGYHAWLNAGCGRKHSRLA